MRQQEQYQHHPTDLITTEAAARLLGISPSTLQMRRVTGLPPRFYKFGPGKHSNVRYSRQDILDYLSRCLKEPKTKGDTGIRNRNGGYKTANPGKREARSNRKGE